MVLQTRIAAANRAPETSASHPRSLSGPVPTAAASDCESSLLPFSPRSCHSVSRAWEIGGQKDGQVASDSLVFVPEDRVPPGEQISLYPLFLSKSGWI